ncbi:MAG: hypothetical protein HUJ26_13945 [Planctomycetaceae bacterium]|nr:hypothetical protein [Planctomycetaceae bacterium]
MAESFNLTLTDELRSFIDQNCGDGTLYSTPSEFVSDLLRQKKQQQEAEKIRQAVIEGYRDSIAGRTYEFEGNLKDLIQKVDP